MAGCAFRVGGGAVYHWKLKYSPWQPRVPEGEPGGGRWTEWGTGRGPITGKFAPAEAGRFRAALDANVRPKHRNHVTKYSPEEYGAMRTYLFEDGKTGFALKPDGDIVSVFSGNGHGKAAVQAAIELGGRKLDCYDGYLRKLYSRFGMREYERWKFDPQYAASDWDYGEFDNPDVVLMRRG